MADVVNLRRARRARARIAKEQHAAENRARFGLPKAERKAREAEDARARAAHAASRLDGIDAKTGPDRTP